MRISFFFIIAFQLTCCSPSDDRCSPFNITLLTTDEQAQKIHLTDKHKAAVIIFLLPDCPACQDYSLTLNELVKTFPDILFAGILPGEYYTLGELKAYINNYHIAFPVYRDRRNELTHCLKASVAPEVFLVSRENKVLYSGRIDDRLYSLSKKKLQPQSHDLLNALTEFSSGKRIVTAKTTAVGCFIE